MIIILVPVGILFLLDQLFDFSWLGRNQEWLIIAVILAMGYTILDVMKLIHDTVNYRLNHIEQALRLPPFVKKDVE